MLKNLLGLKKSVKIIDLSSINLNSSLNDNLENKFKNNHHKLLVNPEGLKEVRLLSPSQSTKDVRLFWLLVCGRFLNNSNSKNQRCLIFVNSKAGVRRLAGIMRQLADVNAFQVFGNDMPKHINVLHADMIQKQRLKALERFQSMLF